MDAEFIGWSKSLKKRKLRFKYKQDIEPQEALLDKLAQKKERDLGFSERKFEVPLSGKVLTGFFVFSLILILFLFGKTFQFQIIEGKKFADLSQDNKFIIHQIQAERGVIYDKNLTQLVSNQPAFDLILNKKNLPEGEIDKEKILKEVSQIINEDFSGLKQRVEESEDSLVLIAENISHQTLIILETKIQEFTGFEIRQDWVRDYKDGENFAHLIGYIGKIKSEELKGKTDIYSVNDYVGRSGIESYYEEVLRKNPGELKIERDALGNILSKEVAFLPESGKSLVLWLDADLQEKIKAVLEDTLKRVGGKEAAAIAMDPNTGGILAMVSLPSFDNNLFQKGADQKALKSLLEDSQKLQPLFNRAVSGRYLTGSTIKPFIASAALEENIIDPNKKINDDKGYISIPNPWDPSLFTIKKDWRTHGWTDMRKALAESCNVYFYTVGGGLGDQKGLGPTKMKEYLELFGWNSKTGIDLPGEALGFIPDTNWKKEVWKENWWDGDTYNLSIGQGYLQITPLEVAVSYAAIANGGTLYQPQIVQKIVKGSSDSMQVVEEINPKILRQNFIDPENLQIVREGMRQSVTGINSPHASSILLNTLSVSSAAKTGTAELGNGRYHNWITVFAPYENPEIVLTIIIQDLKVMASTLAPAKDILEWYFTQGGGGAQQ